MGIQALVSSIITAVTQSAMWVINSLIERVSALFTRTVPQKLPATGVQRPFVQQVTVTGLPGVATVVQRAAAGAASGAAGVGDTLVRVATVASSEFTPEEKMELKNLADALLRELDARVSSHIGNRKYFNDKIIPDFKKLEETTSKILWKSVINQTKNWLKEAYPGGIILPALKDLQDFIDSIEGSRGTKIKTSLSEDEIKDIQHSLQRLHRSIADQIKIIQTGTFRPDAGRFEALIELNNRLPIIYKTELKTEGMDKSKIREIYKQLEIQKIILVDFADEIGSIQNKLIEH